MPTKNNVLEGVDDTELAALVTKAPLLPSMSPEDQDRFVLAVRRLVEFRASNNWPLECPNADCAVFVLVDYPRPVTKRIGATPVLDLPDQGLPIFNRVFFLTRDASNGGFIEFPCDISEIMYWLEDHGFRHSAIVIAHKPTMKMSIRRDGTTDFAVHEVIRDKPPPLTVEELQLALEHFHLDCLVSPEQCSPGLWEPERAHEYVPVREAEKAIQRRMRDVVSGWFRALVRVEPEDKTPSGRIDLRLLAASEGNAGLHYWAIIELKVIKRYRNAPKGKKASKVSKNVNVDAIVEGISQADAYRGDRDLEDGFLEIFDMREDKGEDLMNDPKVIRVRDQCKGNVHCEVRAMFGSAKEARAAGLLS
jgi:hypothetical protein